MGGTFEKVTLKGTHEFFWILHCDRLGKLLLLLLFFTDNSKSKRRNPVGELS